MKDKHPSAPNFLVWKKKQRKKDLKMRRNTTKKDRQGDLLTMRKKKIPRKILQLKPKSSLVQS